MSDNSKDEGYIAGLTQLHVIQADGYGDLCNSVFKWRQDHRYVQILKEGVQIAAGRDGIERIWWVVFSA